jgi:ribosomal protein S18 acetylase RimI-like enzyme
MDAVRLLFREYAAWVGSAICFTKFEHELAGLPGEYSPLLVAEGPGGELAGCVGLRRLSVGVGEMKRLYVRPSFQGSGLGRLLIERVVGEARVAGYGVLRLDTLPVMARAIGLYRAMGFCEIPRYGDNPAEAVCFELGL